MSNKRPIRGVDVLAWTLAAVIAALAGGSIILATHGCATFDPKQCAGVPCPVPCSSWPEPRVYDSLPEPIIVSDGGVPSYSR